jgi:hypothetical protein
MNEAKRAGVGSSFEDFPKETSDYEAVIKAALEEVLSWQLEESAGKADQINPFHAHYGLCWDCARLRLFRFRAQSLGADPGARRRGFGCADADVLWSAARRSHALSDPCSLLDRQYDGSARSFECGP